MIEGRENSKFEQKWQTKKIQMFYSIRSVDKFQDNDADELTTKFWASWNNKVNWAAHQGLMMMVTYPGCARQDLSATSSSR